MNNKFSGDIEQVSMDFVSIIVVVRNEEEHLEQLLQSILVQTLPREQFELIIVDDESTDRTLSIAQGFIDKKMLDLKLMPMMHKEEGASPKKTGITQAVEQAKGEIIAMTDGDCIVGPNWLKTIVWAMMEENIKFISGPVTLEGSSDLLSKIQTIEFSSLVGTGGALISLDYPLMCNGANLAFKNSAFQAVNGYQGNFENSTGDDVFLMQKIHKAYTNSVRFLKDKNSIVSTGAQTSFSDLLQQRKRWASKWNKSLLAFSWALPVFLFVHYVTLLIGFLAIIVQPGNYWSIAILVSIKAILDYIFLKKVMNFCNLRLDFTAYLVSELIYPFYAIFFGTIVHFGKFTWKGRSHKK